MPAAFWFEPATLGAAVSAAMPTKPKAADAKSCAKRDAPKAGCAKRDGAGGGAAKKATKDDAVLSRANEVNKAIYLQMKAHEKRRKKRR